MNQYYIFDNIEIIMGPYETLKEAQDDLDLHQNELYLDLYYPDPYIDVIDEEFDQEGLSSLDIKRERIIKRKEK